MKTRLEKLEKSLGIKIKNEQLYKDALTHSSYGNENDLESNERLEFLGDAVLELTMSDYLYKNFKLSEGEMTKKRAKSVCEQALVIYAQNIMLQDLLLLGKGEELSGGRNRYAILADAFEAILGAIYLDLGYEEVLNVFKRVISPHILEIDVVDYKSTLQELVQADKRTLVYTIVSEQGPSHNKMFEAEVRMDDIVMGHGFGKTKKDAEQNAAKKALEKKAKE